jgi:hypothetical protein
VNVCELSCQFFYFFLQGRIFLVYSFLSNSPLVYFPGTVRRLLENQKDKITAVVFCTTTSTDTEIYKRYNYVAIYICYLVYVKCVALFNQMICLLSYVMYFYITSVVTTCFRTQ